MKGETTIYIFVGEFNVGLARIEKAAKILGGEVRDVLRVTSPVARITSSEIQRVMYRLYGQKECAISDKKKKENARGMIRPPRP